MTAAFLTFRVAGQRFAIPVERVREAARVRKIAPLPGAPAGTVGVALVRGEPVGVFDLGAKEGDAPPAEGRDLLLVLEGRASALLVDRIDGVGTGEDATPLDLDALFGRSGGVP